MRKKIIEWLKRVQWAEVAYNSKCWSGLPNRRRWWKLRQQRQLSWMNWRVVLMVFNRVESPIGDGEWNVSLGTEYPKKQSLEEALRRQVGEVKPVLKYQAKECSPM